MRMQFTLEYWIDGNWLVGRLLEASDVFSQGETLEALRENVREALELMYPAIDGESVIVVA
jgi:predicted RNase H-like HicB family nuclease